MPVTPEAVARALATLGLESNAGPAEARQAHRKLLELLHPDKHAKNPRSQARATAHTQRLNRAWEELSAWYASSASGPVPSPDPASGSEEQAVPGADGPDRGWRAREQAERLEREEAIRRGERTLSRASRIAVGASLGGLGMTHFLLIAACAQGILTLGGIRGPSAGTIEGMFAVGAVMGGAVAARRG